MTGIGEAGSRGRRARMQDAVVLAAHGLLAQRVASPRGVSAGEIANLLGCSRLDVLQELTAASESGRLSVQTDSAGELVVLSVTP